MLSEGPQRVLACGYGNFTQAFDGGSRCGAMGHLFRTCFRSTATQESLNGSLSAQCGHMKNAACLGGSQFSGRIAVASMLGVVAKDMRPMAIAPYP